MGRWGAGAKVRREMGRVGDGKIVNAEEFPDRQSKSQNPLAKRREAPSKIQNPQSLLVGEKLRKR
jgi:hypothetical protein